MPKKQWEVDAKDRFLGFLRERHGHDYTVTGENVVTNPLTGRDYDYELTPNAQGLPIIALEIFRIVGDERDLAHHNAWSDVVNRLTAELNVRGVTGYLIRTPHFNIAKSKRKQFASETADRIAATIAAHATKKNSMRTIMPSTNSPAIHQPDFRTSVVPVKSIFSVRLAKLLMTYYQRKMNNSIPRGVYAHC